MNSLNKIIESQRFYFLEFYLCVIFRENFEEFFLEISNCNNLFLKDITDEKEVGIEEKFNVKFRTMCLSLSDIEIFIRLI